VSWANWSAFRNSSDFGHGRVVVYNSTHLLWEWHINMAQGWVVSDSVVVVNPAPLPPASNTTCNATNLVASHSGPPASCAYFNNQTGHKTVSGE
jgi:hypothetical protein